MQSNRRIQRRSTRTKTVMIQFNPQTEIPSTPTVLNSNEAATINHDTVRIIETEQDKVTSNEHITVINTNNDCKIEIKERQFDFHTMRAFFERPDEKPKQVEVVVEKVEQGIRTEENETLDKEKNFNENQIKEEERKSESTAQNKYKNNKYNKKPKDHVNSHDKETGLNQVNETDKEPRMFKFDCLLNLWKDRFKKVDRKN